MVDEPSAWAKQYVRLLREYCSDCDYHTRDEDPEQRKLPCFREDVCPKFQAACAALDAARAEGMVEGLAQGYQSGRADGAKEEREACANVVMALTGIDKKDAGTIQAFLARGGGKG